MTLSKIRKQINALDDQLIELLATRVELAKKAFEQKLKSGKNKPFSPQREKELFERIAKLSTEKIGISANGIFCEVVSLCRSLEKATQLLVLQTEVPHVEIAARSRFGSYIELIPVFNAENFLEQIFNNNYLGFIKNGTPEYKAIMQNSRIEIIYEYCFKLSVSKQQESYSLVQLHSSRK